MSTIQKAFIFIVLILAVFTAVVQLVLFAQRDNYKGLYDKSQDEVQKLTRDLKSTQQQLDQTKQDKATAVGDLESQLASTKAELDSTKAQLDSALSDKANLSALVATANAKLDAVSKSMDTLAQNNEVLNAAKQAAEEELAKVKAARQDAEEQYTIAKRKVEDLQDQVASLQDQVSQRGEEIRSLEQQVEVLKQYYPSAELPQVGAAKTATIFGKVTDLSNDGKTVYLSIGSDDGVTNGMLLIVFKADGTYAADAKVFNVGAHKAAARVIEPVRAAIAEGDDVANK